MSKTSKLTISIVAAILIGIRIAFPNLKIDSITMGLFIIGLSPWLVEIVKSIKTPTGLEIELKDLKKATKEFSDKPIPEKKSQEISFENVAELDSNLALVYLRVEIEKRLKELAEINGLKPKKNIHELIKDLENSNSLNKNTLSGIQEVITAGNQAVHGAKVNPNISDWASMYGPRIIETLDNEIFKTTPALLNIRIGPGLNYDLLRKPLERGTKLEYIEETENWVKVKVPDGKIGWVMKQYLEKYEETKAKTQTNK